MIKSGIGNPLRRWRIVQVKKFELAEVRGGTIKLEETILPCGNAAGLKPELILINDQKFTKTANCWGVDNNFKGTNTNRIVLLRKS